LKITVASSSRHRYNTKNPVWLERSVRKRFGHAHREILLLFVNGPSLKRTIFTVICLIALLGSSFRPMPGPAFAMGSVPNLSANLDGSLAEPEGEDPGLFYTVYEVKKGDTVSGIADSFDVTVDTILSANDIQSARSLRPSQLLKIPCMSGIIYSARAGDTAESVAKKYKIAEDRLIEVNNLLSADLDGGKPSSCPTPSSRPPFSGRSRAICFTGPRAASSHHGSHGGGIPSPAGRRSTTVSISAFQWAPGLEPLWRAA
jgi:LysM repeat protein